MHKILVVDDEKKSCDFISDLISFHIPDSEITGTDDPLKALSLIKANTYDLLLSDIEMPQMDGLTMLRKIKELGKNPYILLISAYGKFEYAQKGMELGASGYILKPICKEHIQSVIRTYLEKTEKQKTEKQNTFPEILFLRKSNGTFPVKTADIIAVEKQDRYLVSVYLKNDSLNNVRAGLNEIIKQLPKNFRLINRKCIINLKAVKQFNAPLRQVIVFAAGKEMCFIASREGMKQLTVKLSQFSSR